MRILIDIGHPAHVHLFKNFAHRMISKGHAVHFTVRDKECEILLLVHEGFSFTSFGKHYRSKWGKLWGLIKFTWLCLKTCLHFKPDLLLSHGSIYGALTSFLIRKPNIALEDTGNREQVRIYLPFTRAVLTSTSFPISYGHKQVYYDGYHELAYLHPKFFTADPSVIHELGMTRGEKYFIIRFVSWGASHDIGHSGLTVSEKREIVNLLQKYGKVFISSEQSLEHEFEKYKFPLAPERLHDALAFAEMFVGEGATMASESAVLGTHAVYINSLRRGYTNELENSYGLVNNFDTFVESIDKIRKLLTDPELKIKSEKARERMLSEKIDVTSFIVWFIENWPDSPSAIKQNPDFQKHFI